MWWLGHLLGSNGLSGHEGAKVRSAGGAKKGGGNINNIYNSASSGNIGNQGFKNRQHVMHEQHHTIPIENWHQCTMCPVCQHPATIATITMG